MSTLTLKQLRTFHAQDREIFSKLITKFSRPPAESLLVMATWFWLEDFGFENIFSIILALTDPHIVALANEAVSCFQCLESNDPPNGFTQIPVTARFMRKDISLFIIYKHRYTAITGIKNFLTTTCSRIFSDILQQVLPSSSSSSFVTRFHHPLIISGFPHPTFGNFNVMPDVFAGDNLPSNNLFLFPNDIWRWHANGIATENDQTMFITFSRGFPVSQDEVEELFTNIYGKNCVEGIFMQESSGNASNIVGNSYGEQQSLYARLVLNSVTTVDRILNGTKVRKFQLHGKHIWARKYAKRSLHS